MLMFDLLYGTWIMEISTDVFVGIIWAQSEVVIKIEFDSMGDGDVQFTNENQNSSYQPPSNEYL